MPRDSHSFYCFAVVVCRHPTTGLWLAVKESSKKRLAAPWWLPAGGVEVGETFEQGAFRECREEAGIGIVLKGILRVEHSVVPWASSSPSSSSYSRMRVVFFAEPLDPDAPLKSEGDKESDCAEWMTLGQLRELRDARQLRGEELLRWGEYLEDGGYVYPLELLTGEGSGPRRARAARTTMAPAKPAEGEEGGAGEGEDAAPAEEGEEASAAAAASAAAEAIAEPPILPLSARWSAHQASPFETLSSMDAGRRGGRDAEAGRE